MQIAQQIREEIAKAEALKSMVQRRIDHLTAALALIEGQPGESAGLNVVQRLIADTSQHD